MIPLAQRIDALLPQTQCTRCGYEGCRPYAEAIAAGETDINHCPPGGDAGVAKLAALLDRAPRPLDPANGPCRERFLLAGKAGGTLKPGRYIDHNWKQKTPLANLYCEMLRRQGIVVDRFGDSTGGLPHLA